MTPRTRSFDEWTIAQFVRWGRPEPTEAELQEYWDLSEIDFRSGHQ